MQSSFILSRGQNENGDNPTWCKIHITFPRRGEARTQKSDFFQQKDFWIETLDSRVLKLAKTGKLYRNQNS